MKDKDVKSSITHYMDKLNNVQSLFDVTELNISYDKLNNDDESENELLYFKCTKFEKKGLFVFGFSFFIKELEDQEFKNMLSQNSLNFKIYNSYSKLKKNCDCKKECKGVRVNDVLNSISWDDNKLINNPKILRRILTLSYYQGWDLNKDKKSFDEDFYIEIANSSFFYKPKQRYNLTVAMSVYEDDNSLLFINQKADLVFVFKNLDKFSKENIEKDLFKVMKKVFNINKLNIE